MVRAIMRRIPNPQMRSEGRGRQRGFSLLEVMIAGAIMTVGLCALLAVFAVAITSTQNVQLDEIAREKAIEALESIFTARQTDQITFTQIQNTPNGVFTPGMAPLTDPGPDGLDGTGDDVPAAPIMVPGRSGTLTGQSPPDVRIDLSTFQRQITITNVAGEPNLRQVTVTVQYPTSQGLARTYTVQALVSSFR